jgi:hypothetical protein
VIGTNTLKAPVAVVVVVVAHPNPFLPIWVIQTHHSSSNFSCIQCPRAVYLVLLVLSHNGYETRARQCIILHPVFSTCTNKSTYLPTYLPYAVLTLSSVPNLPPPRPHPHSHPPYPPSASIPSRRKNTPSPHQQNFPPLLVVSTQGNENTPSSLSNS